MRSLWMGLTGLAIVALVTGCGSRSGQGTNPDCPNGKCDTISPTSGAGYLVVKKPLLDDDTSVSPPPMTFAGYPVELETKTKFAAGKECLVLQGTGSGHQIVDCSVTILENEVTEYQLAAMVLATNDTETFKTEVGPKAKVTLFAEITEDGFVKWGKSDLEVSLDSFEKTKKAILAPAGKYSLQFEPSVLNPLNTSPAEYAQGDVQQFDLSDAIKYKAAVLFKTPVRGFPAPQEANASIYNQIDRHFVTARNCDSFECTTYYAEPAVGPDFANDPSMRDALLSCYSPSSDFVDFYLFDLSQDATIRMYPFVSEVDGPYLHYEYATNNTSYVIDAKSGKTTVVEGQHLDLDDIRIELTPGDFQNVHATYKIEYSLQVGLYDTRWFQFRPVKYQPYYDGYSSYCMSAADVTSFSTPSGFDLAPGQYKVVFDYMNNNQVERQTFECNLVTSSIPGQGRCTKIDN